MMLWLVPGQMLTNRNGRGYGYGYAAIAMTLMQAVEHVKYYIYIPTPSPIRYPNRKMSESSHCLCHRLITPALDYAALGSALNSSGVRQFHSPYYPDNPSKSCIQTNWLIESIACILRPPVINHLNGPRPRLLNLNSAQDETNYRTRPRRLLMEPFTPPLLVIGTHKYWETRKVDKLHDKRSWNMQEEL